MDTTSNSECRFRARVMKPLPDGGRPIGFDVAINDNDEGKGPLKQQLHWSGMNDLLLARLQFFRKIDSVLTIRFLEHTAATVQLCGQVAGDGAFSREIQLRGYGRFSQLCSVSHRCSLAFHHW